ncbi:MAG: VWA domain-containing protein [Pannonibacter sp.]
MTQLAEADRPDPLTLAASAGSATDRLLPGLAVRVPAEDRAALERAAITFCDRFRPASLQRRALAAAAPALLDRAGAEPLAQLLELASDLGRRGRGGDATLVLAAVPRALRWLSDADDLSAWLAVVADVAERAPESLAPLAGETDHLLCRLGARGLAGFAGALIDLAAGREDLRQALFSFRDPRAETLLLREAADVPLALLEPRLKGLVTALWSVEPVIRPSPAGGAQTARRSSFDGRILFLPDAYRGVRGEAAVTLMKAAALHIGAHLAHSGRPRPAKALKPLQIALISLLEDARAEHLALAQYPGLNRLWLPFHTAPAEGGTAEALLARLARVLADPDHEDPDPFVQKGRAAFREARDSWDDPDVLRRIGSGLGNDLGQMRLQFNSKTYAVQPLYRDDNLGLWQFDLPDQEQGAPDEISISVRIEQRETQTEKPDRRRTEEGGDEVSPVRLTEADPETAFPLCRLPEWDLVSRRHRPDWVQVMEHPPRLAPAAIIDRLLSERPDLVRRTSALIRQARAGQPVRLRRQAEGDRLDLEAALRARIDLAGGHAPDTRVYETRTLNSRDLSVLVLLDISESTKDTIDGSPVSVFSILREAAAHLAAAMAEAGDPFALSAFHSDGREDLRYHRIKRFGETFDTRAKARLAGLRPGLSTRMGGALRMATHDIQPMATHRRLVLIITDGEPSDIDVSDPKHLVEDARKAVQEAAGTGIDVFCVGLDRTGDTYLSRIFGRQNVIQIDRVTALPDRLPKLYLRLTR